MKIIFLDIDGVMNSGNHCIALYNAGTPDFRCRRFTPQSVKALNWLLQDEEIRIVVSSTWRLSWKIDELKKHFEKEGVEVADRIIGYTPNFPREKRGAEIQHWLASHSCDTFVIFDDDSDMGEVKKRLIKTDNRVGLTMKHVRRAKKWLDKANQDMKQAIGSE